MALLTIKPSRGTVAFFVVLAIAVVSLCGYNKHEHHLFVRDAPPTHSTRRLLRCVLGRDAQRVLGNRPAGTSSIPWELAATDRLRRLLTGAHAADWPARCVPIADRLASALQSSRERRRAYPYAVEVRRHLAQAASDPMVAIELVERGALGSQLAALAFEISAISDGAEEGWTSVLAPEPTDLFPVALAELPVPSLVPDEADYTMLALPDLLLYQSAIDRRLHRVTYDASERPTDRAIGRGAPIRSLHRDGATLVSDDEGDSVFLPAGEPAELVPLPESLREGSEAIGAWQVALTPGGLWLLSESDGGLHVRSTPRSGEIRWSDVAAPAGWPDLLAAGGMLVPDASRGDGVGVIAARRGATGLAIERWTLGPIGAPATVTVATRPGGTRPSRGAPASSSASPLVTEFGAFDPQLVTCAAGGSRYILVASDAGLTLVTVRGDNATRQDLRTDDYGPAVGNRFELSCNDEAALLFADFTSRAEALVYFDGQPRSRPRIINPPRAGASPRIVAGALLPDRGLVAIVDNGMSVRAFRSRDRGARWEGGALLAIQQPAQARTADGGDDNSRSLEVGGISAHGQQVALLVTLRAGPRTFIGRLASRDGGATWLASQTAGH